MRSKWFIFSIIAISIAYTTSKDIPTSVQMNVGPVDFDCPMRILALEFAMEIQPFLSKDQLQEIADALNGAEESLNKSCVIVPTNWIKQHRKPASWDDLNDVELDFIPSIFVDFNLGNDNNDASINYPLKHLDFAVEIAQKQYGSDIYKRIILRKGRHYLRKTINITPLDNNLLITNYNNEHVEISGAIPVICTWSNNTGNNQWKIYASTNNIHHEVPPKSNSLNGNVKYIGLYENFNDCYKHILRNNYEKNGFGTFTYYDYNAGDYANQCFIKKGFMLNEPNIASKYTAISGVLQNIYSCDLSKNNNITSINGLRVNGKRAIRARYPNGNPEVYPCGFCSKVKAKKWMKSNCSSQPDKDYNPSYPNRNDTVDHRWQYYDLGVGGCCDIFVPNAGYFCGTHDGEDSLLQSGMTFSYLVGLVYNSSILPNAPYKDVTGGVVQAWRQNHWWSLMFLMDPNQYDADKSTILFSKGGFQGAKYGAAAEFYVENIYEELDYPTEYFLNETTKILYYFNNQSGDPSNLDFEATNLKVLLNYTGTMTNPVSNHVIRGVTFKDSQYTYLDDHAMPSGGGWALQRTGAVYLDGVKNITISNNIFTRLDGNAVSINRYARDVLIYRNEIVWQGDNSISLWGDTQNISFPDGTTMGWDGTDGNQPRGIQLIQNIVHEVGIWEKQSSMWFQAKSCSNILDSNIFFNAPRAGIVFNDGFGGNSTVKKNLLFNTCRESGDHGPFNSWDRQPYVTKVRDGTASDIKQYDYIYQNFMIANYESQEAVDNDDGSCYYKTYNNFLVYSGNGMKNDFGGHDNHQYNNIFGYIGECFSINEGHNQGQIEGHEDWWYNNTCILNKSAPHNYGTFDCETQNATNAWPKLGNNIIYQMSQNTSITGLCGQNEATFQKTNPGVDDGTAIKGPPDDAQIIAQAKALIF